MERIVILEGGLPWGFRIQGGVDTGIPLRIARVNPGSKASIQGIREGDVIAAINGNNSEQLTNAEAHQLLKEPGSNLKLTLTQGNTLSRKVFKTSVTVESKTKHGTAANGSHGNPAGATTVGQSNSDSTSSQGCNTNLQQNGFVELEDARCVSPTSSLRSAHPPKTKPKRNISWDCTKNVDTDQAEDVYAPLQDPNGEARKSFIDSMLSSATSSLTRRRSGLGNRSSKYVTFQNNEEEPLMESAATDHDTKPASGTYTNKNFDHDAQLPYCDMNQTLDMFHLTELTAESGLVKEENVVHSLCSAALSEPSTTESIVDILNDIEYQILQTGLPTTFSPPAPSPDCSEMPQLTTLTSSHNFGYPKNNNEEALELAAHEDEGDIPTQDLCNDSEPLEDVDSQVEASFGKVESGELSQAHGISVEELAEFMEFLGLLKQRQSELMDPSRLKNSSPESQDNILLGEENLGEMEGGATELQEDDGEDMGEYVLEVMDHENNGFGDGQSLFLKRFLHVIPEEGSELSDSKRSSRALSEMSEMTVNSHSSSVNRKSFSAAHTPTLIEDPVDLDALTPDEPANDRESPEIFERYCEIMKRFEQMQTQASERENTTVTVSLDNEYHELVGQDNDEVGTSYPKELNESIAECPGEVDEQTCELDNTNKVIDEAGDEVDTRTSDAEELNEEVDESCLPVTVIDLNSRYVTEQREEHCVDEQKLSEIVAEDVSEEHLNSKPQNSDDSITEDVSFSELDTILEEIKVLTNLTLKSPTKVDQPNEQEADCQLPDKLKKEAKLDSDTEHVDDYLASNCAFGATENVDNTEEMPIVGEANQASLIGNNTMREHKIVLPLVKTGANNVNESVVTLIESPLNILRVVNLLIEPPTSTTSSTHVRRHSSVDSIPTSSTSCPNIATSEISHDLDHSQSFCRSLLSLATTRLQSNVSNSVSDLTNRDLFESPDVIHAEDPTCYPDILGEQSHPTPSFFSSQHQTFPRTGKKSGNTGLKLPDLCESTPLQQYENEKPTSFQLAKQRILALADPKPVGVSVSKHDSSIRTALVSELKEYWNSKQTLHCDSDSENYPRARSLSVPRLDDLVLDFLFRFGTRGTTDGVVNLLYQLAAVLPPKLNAKIRTRFGECRNEREPPPNRNAESVTMNNNEEMPTTVYQDSFRERPPLSPQGNQADAQEYFLNEEHVFEDRCETEEMSMSDKYFYDCAARPEGYYFVDNVPFGLHKSLYGDPFAYHQEYAAPPVPPPPTDVMHFCSNVSYDPRELANASFSVQAAFANETSAFSYPSFSEWSDYYRYEDRVRDDFDHDTDSLPSLPPPPRPPPPEDEWSDGDNNERDAMSYPPTTGIPPRPPVRGRQMSQPAPPMRTVSVDALPKSQSTILHRTGNCDRKRHSSYEGIRNLETPTNSLGTVMEEKERLKATLLSDWLYHARKNILRPLASPAASVDSELSDNRCRIQPGANSEPESFLAWRSDNTQSGALANVIAPRTPQRFSQNQETDMSRPFKTANNATSPRPVSYLELPKAATKAASEVTSNAPCKQRPRSFHELEMEEETKSYAMVQEYQDRLAQRAQRKQQGVIKVSSPARPLPRPPQSPEVPFGSDFANRLKQRREHLAAITDDEFEAIMREEMHEELNASKDHSSAPSSSANLPKRLLEDSALFLSQTTEDEDGVWSPGQLQSQSNRNELVKNESAGEEKKAEQTSETTPVWTPPNVRSPSLERKEFRPVRLDTNTLKKQPSQEREKVTTSSASQAYHEESNYHWLAPDATSTAATTPASETSRLLDSSRPTSTTPGTPSIASSFTLQSSWSQRGPSSSTLSTPAVTPTSHLPRAPNATVTLLQKAREGQLPKGAAYLESNEDKIYRSPQEKLYTIKREYESEDEQRRKIVELAPKKYTGIGPTSQEGIPLALRTGVQEENQHQWYRRMYDSLHRAGKQDDYVVVRYKTRGRYPYGGGYQSEPEPCDYNYDSDASYNAGRYSTLDRRRNTPSSASRTGYQDTYRNQPGRIEDFEPGRSSISEKENKQAAKAVPPTRSFTSFALKESGYESDSQLVFRRRSEQDTSSTANPLEQRAWYRDIQKGGDVPLHGLRKPAPDRPQEGEIDEAQLAFYQALLHRNQFEFEKHSMQDTYYPPLFQEPPPYIPPPPPPERVIRSAYAQPPQPPQRRSSPFSSTLRKLNFAKKFSKIMTSTNQEKATAVFYTADEGPRHSDDTKKPSGKETNVVNPTKDIRVQSLPSLPSESHRKDAKLPLSGSVVKNAKPPKKPTREIKTVLTKTKLFRPIKETKQFRVRRSSSLSSASTPSSPRSPLTRSVRSLSTTKVEKKEYSDDTSALTSHNAAKNGFIHRKTSSQTTTTVVSTAKVGGGKLNPSKDSKQSPSGDKTIEIVVKYSPKALQVLHSTPHKSVALTTSKSPSPAPEMTRADLKVDRKSSSESSAKGNTADSIYLKQKKGVTESKFRSQDFVPATRENGIQFLHTSATAEKLPQDTKLIVAKLSTGEMPSPQKIRHPVETPIHKISVEESRSADAVGANTKSFGSKAERKHSDLDLNDPNFSCDEATAAILLAELEKDTTRKEDVIDLTKKSTQSVQKISTVDIKPVPKRETSRDRLARRESQEYRHYVSELRHSSPKNDRFSQLKSLYNSLERLSQLEKTASCSDLHKLSSEGVIDFEMWRKLRNREKAEEELRTLKLCIVQAQKQGECLFTTKEAAQMKWKGDPGLRIKKDSVDLLREKFEVESNTSNSPPAGSANGENKDSYRSLWRAESVNEVAHKYQKRERLARSHSLKSHFGRGDPMYTSLSLEQINSLKGRLNQLYGSKVGLESAPTRPKSPSPATRRRYEVVVTDASKSINRSSGGYQEELYVRSNSDKDKNSTYDATLEREASLRQGKALSISGVNQSRCLSEAEKKQLSHSLSQEIKEKYMQSVSRRTPPKRSSSIGATTRNAFYPKSSTSAAVNYVRNLSQKLADSYVQNNPPSRLSNSSFESDQSHRSDFLLVLTPKPAQDHAFSDVEEAVREWAQQSKRTSVTRSGVNPDQPVSLRGYDYNAVDWYHADDASTSSNSSAQTVIHREVSNKVRFFEEKIARAQSPTPGSHERSIKVYRSVSDLKDYLLYKTSVTSLSSATQSRNRLASGSKSLSRTQSLPRKLTYTLCKAPNPGTSDNNALMSPTSRLSRSDTKKSSRDDSWEAALTENVFATLPNRKRKSNVDYFTSEYVPEKCVSSMDITASAPAPPTPPPLPTSSSAIVSKSTTTASTQVNSRSYNRSYLTLVKAGDVNQKRQLFSESSVPAVSLDSVSSRNELRRQSSLPTVARSTLKPKEPTVSHVTVKGQERGDIRSIKRKYEDPQRVRRSSSLRSTREIIKSPPQRSSSLRDASASRERERSSSSPGLVNVHGSEVERLREKFENLSERRARLEARSSYRSLFSSVPSLGAETSPLPTLNWAKRFGTPREIKRGSEQQRDSKRKHVSFPNNLDQFDPPSSPSQTSSSSRRSSSMLVKPTLLSAARMAYLQAKNSIDNGTNFKYPQSRKNSSLRNINLEPVRLSRRDSLQQSTANRKESLEEVASSRKESNQSVESTESARSERVVLPGINLIAATKVQKESTATAKPKLSTESMRSVSKGKLSLSTFDPSLHRPKSRYTPIPDFVTQNDTNYNTFPRSKRSISSTAPPSRPPPPVDLAYPTASASRIRSSSTSLTRSMSLREPSSQYSTGSYGADWNGTPQGASHRFAESQVNIHYKSPIRNLQTNSQEEDEEEMRQRQAEHMRRVYEQERRRKYLQELQDIEMRRHTDNFTPLQKSPIPLNRYDDFMEEQSRAVSRDRERTPEPKVVARALYNFVALNARELSFQKGDIIFVRRQIDKNWYEGEHNALVGIFPVNYVEIIPYDSVRVSAKKPTEGQARAKYNFMAQSPMELSLVKGELVVITRQIDDRWLEGRIGNRKGIFPANYVDIIAVPSEKTMVTASKPVSHPASHSLITNGTLRNYRTPYSVQSQPNHDPMPRMGAGRGIRATPPLPPTAMSTSLHIDTHTEPVMYRALYSYKPQNDDELELEESDIVSVLEKCDDGWYVGTSQRTGQFGTFPGNYVERV